MNMWRKSLSTRKKSQRKSLEANKIKESSWLRLTWKDGKRLDVHINACEVQIVPSPPDSLSHRPSQAMRPVPHEDRLYLTGHIPVSHWT